MSGTQNNNEEMLQHLLDSMPIDDYEGRSSKEMHYMVYEPFCNNSPFTIKSDINQKVLQNVPFYCLVKFLLETINTTQPVKLTSRGYLPPKIVKKVYSKQFLEEQFFDEKIEKIVREPESIAVTNARIISELAGLIKNRKGEISITKKGMKLLQEENHAELFSEIFKAFTTKFNWSFNDGYGDNNIAQFGFAYTLEILSKYGTISRNVDFYQKKYKQAFGNILMQNIKSDEDFTEKDFSHCYIIRTINRFLVWFGLVFIADDQIMLKEDYYLEKSNIFNSLFSFD